MKNLEIKTEKMSLVTLESSLSLAEMENITAGSFSAKERYWGCALTGLSAGLAAGINPLVGGLATAACFLLN